MPRKKAASGHDVYVVLKQNGIDSIYATSAAATQRSETLLKKTATDPSSIKIELHRVKDEPPAEPAPKASDSPRKTKSAEEQRAANAAKPTKSADDDLPDNIRALLAGNGDVLSGKSIVVTGVPPTLQRKNAEKLVQIYGGKLLRAVSSKTSFVVVGNDAGPKKLEQIESLGLETMDEDDFVKILEEAGAGKRREADGDEPKGKRQKR